MINSRSGDKGRANYSALLLGVALAGILFAILLTRSRGGLIVALLAILLGGWGILRRRRLSKIHWGPLAIVLAVLVTALVDSRTGSSRARSRDVGQHVHRTMGSTCRPPSDLARGATGAGTIYALLVPAWGVFVRPFRCSTPQPRQFDYSYAESGYLQVAVETGLLGTCLLDRGVGCVSGVGLWEFWRSASADDDWEWTLAAAVGLCR